MSGRKSARRESRPLRVQWNGDHYVYGDGIGPATCAIADLEREREKGRVHRGEL